MLWSLVLYLFKLTLAEEFENHRDGRATWIVEDAESDDR